MKRIIAIALVFATASLLAEKRSSEKVFLQVPEVSWEELEPYLIANLRVEYREGEIFVGTSGATRERDLFEPYVEVFGEWATVLLIHLIADRKVLRTLRKVAREIVTENPSAAEMDRFELTELFWKRLESQGRFVPRLRKLYEETQQEGAFRCSICENGFEPQYLRWQ